MRFVVALIGFAMMVVALLNGWNSVLFGLGLIALAIANLEDTIRQIASRYLQSTRGKDSTDDKERIRPSEPTYCFWLDGKDSGPHTLTAMRQLRSSGKLTDDILVMRQGDGQWKLATEFREICK